MVTLNRLLAVLALLVFSLTSEAAVVTSVKGDKALINLEGADTVVGEDFYLVDPTTNKKKAIIRIKQIKQGRAVADVLKGKAENGFTLQVRIVAQNEKPAPVAESRSRKKTPYSAASQGRSSTAPGYLRFAKDSWGLIGEYLSNSMAAQYASSQQATLGKIAGTSMTGTGLGFGGFYDYAYTSDFIFEGLGALEQFNVAGPSNLSTDPNCNVKIQYLSMYAIAKYNFTEGHYRAWAGAGGGLLLALSKSSNILDTGQITTNQTYLLEVGVDIQTSRKNYIPVSIQYEGFPSSPTVTASMIVLKAGWAWNL